MDFRGKHYAEYMTDNGLIKKFILQGAHFLAPCWNKLIKKIFLIKNNLLFRDGIIHEDELWTFFVIKKIESIALSEKYSYIYNINKNSLTQSEAATYNSLRSWAIILNEFQPCGDTLPSFSWKNIYS
jgi:hypothetical protein